MQKFARNCKIPAITAKYLLITKKIYQEKNNKIIAKLC